MSKALAWKETLIEHLQSAFDSEMFKNEEGDALIRLEDAICYVDEFAPPTRKPLSAEKITDLVDKYHGYPKTLCRAIEVEHGITGVSDE